MPIDSTLPEAPIRTTVAEASFQSMFSDIAAGAGDRDAERRAPFEEVAALKRAGFGALRLPRSQGGSGLRFSELMEIVVELAKADSNIAHIFRNHFGAVEAALLNPSSPKSNFLLDRTRRGETFGGAFSELGLAAAGATNFETTFRRDGNRYLLSGTKFYSTGNLYADWLDVNGRLEDGRPATAIIPVSRPGVDLVDDWDGIGQRLTGSGTTRFVDVVIDADELNIIDSEPNTRSYRAVFAQLYLSAVIAGIIADIHQEALRLVRARSRNFYHGQTERPRDEGGVQELVGRISTNAWLSAVIVREAANALEQAQDSERRSGNDEEARMRASIAAARVKIVVDEIGPATANLLFEVGGGQTIRQGLQLDRHWRNIKALSAHNPSIYKLRIIGDHELNGTPVPKGPFF